MLVEALILPVSVYAFSCSCFMSFTLELKYFGSNFLWALVTLSNVVLIPYCVLVYCGFQTMCMFNYFGLTL